MSTFARNPSAKRSRTFDSAGNSLPDGSLRRKLLRERRNAITREITNAPLASRFPAVFFAAALLSGFLTVALGHRS